MATTAAPPRSASGAPSHRAAPRHRPFVALVRRGVADRMTLAGVVAVLMLGMGLMVGALWPPLEDVFADLADAFPSGFDALLGGVPLSTPVGWTNAELMSMIAPAGAIAAAVVSAGRATAGEEDARTLGLVLGSAPVERVTFLLAKATAMVAHVVVVCVGLAAGLVLGSLVGDMGLSFSGIVGATAHTGALGVLFGAVALLVGSTTGNRRLTTVVSAGLATLAFTAASFLPAVDALAGGAKASPWYYFSSSVPLANGVHGGHLLVLVTASVVVTLVAVWAFPRRDLRG